MKPFQELLAYAEAIETAEICQLLCVYPEYVNFWKPRTRLLPDGRTVIEPGWEPSAGFIAVALAIFHNYDNYQI